MTKRSKVDKLVDDAFLPTASKKAVKEHLALLGTKFSDKDQAEMKKLTKGLDFNDLHYGDSKTKGTEAVITKVGDVYGKYISFHLAFREGREILVIRHGKDEIVLGKLEAKFFKRAFGDSFDILMLK